VNANSAVRLPALARTLSPEPDEKRFDESPDSTNCSIFIEW